jgi:hypothetical protein
MILPSTEANFDWQHNRNRSWHCKTTQQESPVVSSKELLLSDSEQPRNWYGNLDLMIPRRQSSLSDNSFGLQPTRKNLAL